MSDDKHVLEVAPLVDRAPTHEEILDVLGKVATVPRIGLSMVDVEALEEAEELAARMGNTAGLANQDLLDAARYRWPRDGNLGHIDSDCVVLGYGSLDKCCDEGIDGGPCGELNKDMQILK